MVKEPNMNHDKIKQYLDEVQQQHILQVGTAIRANEQQVGGAHYATKAIQPWDFIIANNLGYLEGNIVKYVSRWKDKGGVQDLKKAQHYLQKLIEVNDER
jgi:hypothetical protein